ncbi:hypothetical protein D3C72_1307220 [compost metagenome]
MPNSSATAVDSRPTISDTRAPQTSPAVMSRPSISVPKGYSALVKGRISGSATIIHGDSSYSSGAARATTTTISMMTRPATAP